MNFDRKVHDKANEVILDMLSKIKVSNDLDQISALSQAIQRITWLAEIKKEEK